MRLVIVRHYKTASNESGKIIGWGDSPPVKGWRQDISFVNDTLRQSKIQIDRIYTSELRRARNTGLFYAYSLGVKKVHHSAEINEINYGDISKKSKQWVRQHIPEYKKDPDFIYPNGESFRQMQKRSIDYIIEIAEKHPDDVVMVVVHAGIIRGLICHFLGLDYASNLNQNVGHRYIGIFDIKDKNCCHYDEAGAKSGFVKQGIIKVPFDSEI
jgi:broad specificity phosphatase PhoE